MQFEGAWLKLHATFDLLHLRSKRNGSNRATAKARALEMVRGGPANRAVRKAKIFAITKVDALG